MPGKLIVVRHSESEYNAKGLWTGLTNVGLTDKGHADATKVGELIIDLPIDKGYVSQLKRAVETKNDILAARDDGANIEVRKTAALNERDYGDYTGLDKWEVKEKVGEETFNNIRRAYDEPVPNGETLKDVYERVVPWYREIVLPQLHDGKNILIVAHGNSNRALRKYIEQVSDEDVKDVEMSFDEVYIYEVDSEGYGVTQEIRRIDTEKLNKY